MFQLAARPDRPERLGGLVVPYGVVSMICSITEEVWTYVF